MLEDFFDMLFYFYIWVYFSGDFGLLISNDSFHALMVLSSNIPLYPRQFCFYFLWVIHNICGMTSPLKYEKRRKWISKINMIWRQGKETVFLEQKQTSPEYDQAGILKNKFLDNSSSDIN